MSQPHEEHLTVGSAPKQKLSTLIIRHGVLLMDLARESGQRPLVIWGMITGHPVKRQEAVQVIQALNALRETNYTCESVVLVLEEERDERY